MIVFFSIASPTGGDSPTEDRISNSLSPPPPPSAVATPLPTTASNKNGPEPEDFRRDVLETRIHIADRDRRPRLKVEEQLSRALETEVYSEKQDIPQVKFYLCPQVPWRLFCHLSILLCRPASPIRA